MGAPSVPPPPGTQWVRHQNVILHQDTTTLDADLSGTLNAESYGWWGEFQISPDFNLPDVPIDNNYYWFDRWWFASFRLYLSGSETGEILAVQPGLAAGEVSGLGLSASPFSGGQNIFVKQGEAWVEISSLSGHGPAWPPVLHVRFTLPRWGTDHLGIPIPATPRSGAGLFQWRGDVWAAEPISSLAPPPGGTTGGGVPVVLRATARPSPTPPPFQLHWPQQERVASGVPAEPGAIVATTFPRWGLATTPLLVYELYEHWRASAPGQTAETRYEREYTLVKAREPGSVGAGAVWDAAYWNQTRWKD